ncbi:MAG: PD-(D/E)XK nuclease family protein [Caldisericia bacterium]|jgi:DNA helicase-2/ATP-dependent DNA helicase PcrA|nr:PD-(D/E)XK nuclease family protein [Caldisericia bacterium]
MKLSFSKIRTYLECPLKYYFLYELKLKEKPKPYKSFGKTLHLTLSKFHTLPKYPSFEKLKEIYETYWIGEGFKDSDEEKKEFLRGLELLKKYYYKNIFNYEMAYKVETEVKFKVNDFEIFGFIDRIDKINDDYEVIEYKTGKYNVDFNAIGLIDESELLQMSIYYIAFENEFKKPPRFLSIYYLSLDYDSKKRINLKEENLKESIDLIIDVGTKIKNKKFYKKENNFCRYCDFKKECSEWKM